MGDVLVRRRKYEQWNNTHELLAQILEMLSVMRNEQLAGFGGGHRVDGDIPPLVNVPRPGQALERPKEPSKKKIHPAALAMFMGS